MCSLCAVETLIDPSELLSLAQQAAGQQWEYPAEDTRFAPIFNLLASQALFVASFSTAPPPAAARSSPEDASEVLCCLPCTHASSCSMCAVKTEHAATAMAAYARLGLREAGRGVPGACEDREQARPALMLPSGACRKARMCSKEPCAALLPVCDAWHAFLRVLEPHAGACWRRWRMPRRTWRWGPWPSRGSWPSAQPARCCRTRSGRSRSTPGALRSALRPLS